MDEPDPIQPLIGSLTQLLRDELNELKASYDTQHQQGMQRLETDENWAQLEPEQRNSLLSAQHLTIASKPDIQVGSTKEILDTLSRISLSALADRVAAMPSRFDTVLVGAAEMMEPEVQFISVPRRTIKTPEDVDAWLKNAKEIIEVAMKNGPVIVS